MRFGEPITEAARRLAREELGVTVSVGELLGYIEYPSRYDNGLDSTVGLALRAGMLTGEVDDPRELRSECAWFTAIAKNMHDEQREFLTRYLDVPSRGPDADWE